MQTEFVTTSTLFLLLVISSVYIFAAAIYLIPFLDEVASRLISNPISVDMNKGLNIIQNIITKTQEIRDQVHIILQQQPTDLIMLRALHQYLTTYIFTFEQIFDPGFGLMNDLNAIRHFHFVDIEKL